MTVFLGRAGQVALSRGSSGDLVSVVSPQDVIISLNRLGFGNAIGNLLTGDRVEIRTTDTRGLIFLPLSTWGAGVTVWPKSFTAYINVNQAGGLRFFRTYKDAVNNDRSLEVPLRQFSGDSISITVAVRDIDYNIVGNVTDFEFNTEREDIDTTLLTDKFRQRYSAGLISGNGQISTLFDTYSSDTQEPPLVMVQTLQRLENGSNINLQLYLTQAGTGSNNVRYEFDAMIVRSGISVQSDAIIEATIDFVSTGEIKLLVGEPDGASLGLILQQGGNLLTSSAN